MSADVLQGDCLAPMRAMDANSVDAIVCDPPYGLSFMGRDWDHGVPGVPFWAECLRVAKPGAHLVAFGGTRTSHRLVCAIEDAGWEIRDSLVWLYGSGFPKSLDVSKAMDKAAGEKREVVGVRPIAYPDSPSGYTSFSARSSCPPKGGMFSPGEGEAQHGRPITAPMSEQARQWDGWGTALKPGHEPICLARKPLAGTVAQTVAQYGTGALNIGATRIGTTEDCSRTPSPQGGAVTLAQDAWTKGALFGGRGHDAGRWPANVVLDEDAARLLDEQSGERKSGSGNKGGGTGSSWQGGPLRPIADEWPASVGGASRFFYCAKSSRAERSAGLGDLPASHPCVKPVRLMSWLVKLVCPPGGLVLDPFAGSGSTGVACVLEGFRFLGIEQDEAYCEISRRRIAYWQREAADVQPELEIA